MFSAINLPTSNPSLNNSAMCLSLSRAAFLAASIIPSMSALRRTGLHTAVKNCAEEMGTYRSIIGPGRRMGASGPAPIAYKPACMASAWHHWQGVGAPSRPTCSIRTEWQTWVERVQISGIFEAPLGIIEIPVRHPRLSLQPSQSSGRGMMQHPVQPEQPRAVTDWHGRLSVCRGCLLAVKTQLSIPLHTKSHDLVGTLEQQQGASVAPWPHAPGGPPAAAFAPCQRLLAPPACAPASALPETPAGQPAPTNMRGDVLSRHCSCGWTFFTGLHQSFLALAGWRGGEISLLCNSGLAAVLRSHCQGLAIT
jgi:hypothetical protein